MSIADLLDFQSSNKIRPLVQSEASECGLVCLAMIAAYYGMNESLMGLRRRFPISLKGASLDQIIDIANALNFSTRPLRLEMEELSQLQMPCILHWNLCHFVVLRSVGKTDAIIIDPSVGEIKIGIKTISSHFTGVALELLPNIDFKRKPLSPAINVSSIIGKILGLKRGMAQIFVLAIILESIAILSPMLNQWITDEAIVSGEKELLGLLCGGLIYLGIAHACVSALRTWIGLYISKSFSLQWMSNIMGYMLRLPIDYFERRHLGDIVSRFGSVHAIETMLTTAMVDIFLDGLLAIGTLMMMFIYLPLLAMISSATIVLYAGIRWLRYSSIRVANQGLIVKQSLEQTYFLETIRGVRSIKLFNREKERKASWINCLVAVNNADIVFQKLNLKFSALWSILSTIERGAIFWLGASSVIDGRLTLGMFFAFIGYKEQFTAKASALVEKFVEFSMLGIQTERLADIVLTTPEEPLGISTVDLPKNLTLAFKNVTFRHSANENFILKNVSFSIEEGECVALVGPSGGGKTTTMKLMLGILREGAGRICIGGIPITKIGLSKYREIIATVMQDDQLYSGSIFDNISFFDTIPDKQFIEECAKHVGVHNDIIEMPMGYHTLVGDMGTVLSGGQKQRVLVARALYKRPKILFLDEATSHLDVASEQIMNAAISELKITRIIIAHRLESIAIADRVIHIENGRSVERVAIRSNRTTSDF